MMLPNHCFFHYAVHEIIIALSYNRELNTV